MSTPFTVVDGGRDRRPVVCTACGSRFADRADLDAHWTAVPECQRSLGAPIGNFGAPAADKHCERCHRSARCPVHGSRCPAC